LEAGRSRAERLRGLKGEERLAVVGVVVMLASLPLPWWTAPTEGDLVVTGLGEFSFAEAALVVTAAAIVFLVLEIAVGYVPPRPLREWGLLVAGGGWAALIVVYRMFDRPDFTLGEVDEPHGLGYGIMVALGGAAIVVAAGLRRRSRPERE
jgi:hypothetical protein